MTILSHAEKQSNIKVVKIEKSFLAFLRMWNLNNEARRVVIAYFEFWLNEKGYTKQNQFPDHNPVLLLSVITKTNIVIKCLTNQFSSNVAFLIERRICKTLSCNSLGWRMEWGMFYSHVLLTIFNLLINPKILPSKLVSAGYLLLLE